MQTRFEDRRFKDFRSFSHKRDWREPLKLLLLCLPLVILLALSLYGFTDQLLQLVNVPSEALTGIWTCRFTPEEGELPEAYFSEQLRLEVVMDEKTQGEALLRDDDMHLLHLKLRYKWGKITMSNQEGEVLFRLSAVLDSEGSALDMRGNFTAERDGRNESEGVFAARQGGAAP